MSEKRKQILQMLAEGKINADEAERLLDALGAENMPASSASNQESRDGKRIKTMHVIVQDQPGQEGDHDRVHIKIPMVMLKAGMKLKSVMPDKIRESVNMRLSEKGINFDELNFEKLEGILESLKEGSIDIEEGGEKIHIFCD